MAAFKARIRDGISSSPIFNSNQPVSVHIKFYMRRPNSHFKKSSRLEELKARLPFAHVVHPDIDNLAKFVLDGMNKLVYYNGKQIAKLVFHKLFDSEGDCNGRTVVEVLPFEDGRVDSGSDNDVNVV